MRRPGVPVTAEILAEEVCFILKTLLREDLFGRGSISLSEAERVIDRSISLSLAEFSSFLTKQNLVVIDEASHTITVADAGRKLAKSGKDADLRAKVGEHFAREIAGARLSVPPSFDLGSVRRSSIPSGTEAAPDDILDRRYRRGDLMGSGPFGAVYKGEQLGLGRPVAVKELRTIFQLVSYLRREDIARRSWTATQAQATLSHPGVVQILDQNHEREFPYVVTEYLPGGNLRDRLNSTPGGRLPVKTAVRVLSQICHALKYAHSLGVTHLNVKPENVLFDSLGNVKLSDFGLARLLERSGEPGESQPPVIVSSGSVAYMAPERSEAEAGEQPGPAADVYSVGILAYQILTGRLPGRRSLLPSQMRREVPPGFDEVFDRMTRDELKERYARIEQVLEGLAQAFPDEPGGGILALWSEDPGPQPKPGAAARSEAPSPDYVTGDLEARDPIRKSQPVGRPSRPPPADGESARPSQTARPSRPPGRRSS